MSCKEAGQKETINKTDFIYRVIGPVIEHNYLCAVCREESAVIDASCGILQPCWSCQRNYKLKKLYPSKYDKTNPIKLRIYGGD